MQCMVQIGEAGSFKLARIDILRMVAGTNPQTLWKSDGEGGEEGQGAWVIKEKDGLSWLMFSTSGNSFLSPEH